jgi:hypothetical protein
MEVIQLSVWQAKTTFGTAIMPPPPPQSRFRSYSKATNLSFPKHPDRFWDPLILSANRPWVRSSRGTEYATHHKLLLKARKRGTVCLLTTPHHGVVLKNTAQTLTCVTTFLSCQSYYASKWRVKMTRKVSAPNFTRTQNTTKTKCQKGLFLGQKSNPRSPQ